MSAKSRTVRAPAVRRKFWRMLGNSFLADSLVENAGRRPEEKAATFSWRDGLCEGSHDERSRHVHSSQALARVSRGRRRPDSPEGDVRRTVRTVDVFHR